MNTPLLEKIERQIRGLSPDEKLSLIERLVHDLRRSIPSEQFMDEELSAMAADSEIQRELKAIQWEFAVTEADGLE
jgi:hypothetical protein